MQILAKVAIRQVRLLSFDENQGFVATVFSNELISPNSLASALKCALARREKGKHVNIRV